MTIEDNDSIKKEDDDITIKKSSGRSSLYWDTIPKIGYMLVVLIIRSTMNDLRQY